MPGSVWRTGQLIGSGPSLDFHRARFSIPDCGMILGTVPKAKRPRDPNQLAAWAVAVSTGQFPRQNPNRLR